MMLADLLLLLEPYIVAVFIIIALAVFFWALR